jgi:hypothetical protein
MFRSLRFRLPALFLAGAALAGLVSTIISIGLFQDYTEDRLLAELQREATGLTSLYAEQARRISEAPEGQQPIPLATRRLERASGSQLYYAGARVFYGQPSGLRTLPHNIVPWRDGQIRRFDFTPPGADREYLAVSSPLRLAPNEPYFGTLVVAKPKAELRERWFTLIPVTPDHQAGRGARRGREPDRRGAIRRRGAAGAERRRDRSPRGELRRHGRAAA